MKSKQTLVLAILIAANVISAIAGDGTPPKVDASVFDCGGKRMSSLDELCQQAVSEDHAVAENAIRALRARGEFGLRALLDAQATTIQQHAVNPAGSAEPAWQRLRAALDAVSGQHDCHASQLFWFTDFEQAKAAARAQAKPILSLRLLGRLDEEFSCANSRFFRTTLYANAEVAKYLREHFILHWKSVRPVPRVTIDFGDGRKLERTLTGNSIHYVLDSSGEVIDALPGLYGAQAFLAGLRRAESAAQQIGKALADERPTLLVNYHRTRLAALDAEFAADLQRISAPSGIELLPDFSTLPQLISFTPPPAQTAARVAVGKGFVERPILDRTQPRVPTTGKGGSAGIDDETWSKLAALHADEAALDNESLRLIREKSPSAFAAGRVAATKWVAEDPMLRQIRNLQRSISEDTVRNEYSLHRQLHTWFAEEIAPRELEALNAKVYAELFLTPDSDPWLGLLAPDTFAALDAGGVKLTAQNK